MQVRDNPIFKVILIGDDKVGKTVLSQSYCENSFTERYEQTIGVDFKIFGINFNDTSCKLQIWDASGQERFRSITQAYYRGAHAVLLCFDLTNKESFENIKQWKKDAENQLGEKKGQFPWFLVGTKNDLQTSRQVNADEAQELAHEIGATYFETSAKTGENVNELFTDVATQCLAKVPKNEMEVEEKQSLSALSSEDDCGDGLFTALQVQKNKVPPQTTTKNYENHFALFSTVIAGAVGGACVGAGVGLIFSGATFGSSVIAGMVIGAFLGAVIAMATYRCFEGLEDRQLTFSSK